MKSYCKTTNHIKFDCFELCHWLWVPSICLNVASCSKIFLKGNRQIFSLQIAKWIGLYEEILFKIHPISSKVSTRDICWVQYFQQSSDSNLGWYNKTRMFIRSTNQFLFLIAKIHRRYGTESMNPILHPYVKLSITNLMITCTAVVNMTELKGHSHSQVQAPSPGANTQVPEKCFYHQCHLDNY